MLYRTSITLLILVFAISFAHAHVTLDNPKGGETITPITEITIKWTETQSHGENNWDLYYSLDGGVVWQEIVLDLDEGSRDYVWKSSITETSTAKIKIVQDNKSGTDYEGVSGNFTISSNPPNEGTELEIVTSLEEYTIHSSQDIQLINYPNPFNAKTTIQFSISKKSHVKLNVYNMLGKIVFTGVDETLDKGTYKILWKNHGFPDGIYLSKLMAGNQKITSKMILRQ